MFFFYYTGDSISTVEGYDPIVGRWQISEPMTTLRSRVGVAVLNGKTGKFSLKYGHMCLLDKLVHDT